MFNEILAPLCGILVFLSIWSAIKIYCKHKTEIYKFDVIMQFSKTNHIKYLEWGLIIRAIKHNRNIPVYICPKQWYRNFTLSITQSNENKIFATASCSLLFQVGIYHIRILSWSIVFECSMQMFRHSLQLTSSVQIVW